MRLSLPLEVPRKRGWFYETLGGTGRPRFPDRVNLGAAPACAPEAAQGLPKPQPAELICSVC